MYAAALLFLGMIAGIGLTVFFLRYGAWVANSSDHHHLPGN